MFNIIAERRKLMSTKHETKVFKYNLIKNAGGVLIGVFSVIESIVVGNKSLSDLVTSFTSKNIYGGDAYTGIQNAAADAANNAASSANKIVYAAECMRSGFAAILLVAGLVLICFCLFNILESRAAAAEKASAPETAETVGSSLPESYEVFKPSPETVSPAADTAPAVSENTEPTPEE